MKKRVMRPMQLILRYALFFEGDLGGESQVYQGLDEDHGNWQKVNGRDQKRVSLKAQESESSS